MDRSRRGVRVLLTQLRAAFEDGWTVKRIEPQRFAVNEGFTGEAPYAWLARVVRAG